MVVLDKYLARKSVIFDNQISNKIFDIYRKIYSSNRKFLL